MCRMYRTYDISLQTMRLFTKNDPSLNIRIMPTPYDLHESNLHAFYFKLSWTMYGFPGPSAATPNLLPAGLTGSTNFPSFASLISNKYKIVAAIPITSFWANR